MRQKSVAACALLLLSSCAGSIIPSRFLPQGTPDFDFRHPPCEVQPTPVGPSQMSVRYLGSGGVAVQWGDDVLLLGPYFSHAGGAVAAQFGHVHFDRARIAAGLKDVDLAHVRAIVTGHAHFDHLGDLPVVAQEYVTSGPIYTNATGRNRLAAYPAIAARVVAVDDVDRWIDVGSSMRIRPIRSEHAPQLCRLHRWPCTYAKCETTTPETRPWEGVLMRDLCGGQAFAYVIDLLDAQKQVRFRIYYNDAAAPELIGAPPPDLAREHRFDLAILCMASFDLVDGYPDWLLGQLQPRHVLLSHYEDFFVKQRTPAWSFAPLLTDAKASRFMECLRHSLKDVADPRGPSNHVCGPATKQWSMPVPNGIDVFDVD